MKRYLDLIYSNMFLKIKNFNYIFFLNKLSYFFVLIFTNSLVRYSIILMYIGIAIHAYIIGTVNINFIYNVDLRYEEGYLIFDLLYNQVTYSITIFDGFNMEICTFYIVKPCIFPDIWRFMSYACLLLIPNFRIFISTADLAIAWEFYKHWDDIPMMNWHVIYIWDVITFLFWFFFLCFFICVFFINSYDIKLLKRFSIFFFNFITFFIFFLFLIFAVIRGSKFYYIKTNLNFFDFFDLNLFLYLDGISVLFIFLTTILFSLVALLSLNNIKYNFKLFLLNLIILEFLIIIVFLCSNFFFFYLFFELSLLPMFLIIGMWGSRQRKIFALYQFFFYTILGSIFLLSAILIIYLTFGTVNIFYLHNYFISYERQLVLWIFIFLGFSTKIPLVPFHVWLPEAHVEAPTAGSVILAGILLKIGSYGMFRFLLPLFPFANFFYLPFIHTLCLCSIIYISLIILTQVDLKKIIAYASILHMNFIILGLFSFTYLGILGSIFLMLSHGLISSGLFICIGVLYDRYKTRNLLYYGGLTEFMPIFSIFFFILILANFGFPLTSNFIGELLVFLGLIETNWFLVFILILSTFFGSLYSIWLYNRLMFGQNKYFYQVSDISEKEFFILFVLCVLVILLGCAPMYILSILELPIYTYLQYLIY